VGHRAGDHAVGRRTNVTGVRPLRRAPGSV
jgi:hypothetical protein